MGFRFRRQGRPCTLKALPTVLRFGPYRLFSADRNEPAYVHVERDESEAKFWLDPVQLARSFGFTRTEIAVIERIVNENVVALREAWNEYFGN